MSAGPTAASRPSVPVLDAQAAELKAERLWGMADAQKPGLSVPSERLDVGEVRCCCSDSAGVFALFVPSTHQIQLHTHVQTMLAIETCGTFTEALPILLQVVWNFPLAINDDG